MSTSKTILVDVVAASKKYRPSKGYTVVVDGKTSIGFEVKKVDSLPETGETKYLYLVPKEGSGDDACDEYVWALKDADTYGWEHIGSTTVEIKLYDTTGDNTDGAMTQRAVTNALSEKADSSDIPAVVQTTGTSTTAVMSQNAVTSYVDTQVGAIDTALQTLLNGTGA